MVSVISSVTAQALPEPEVSTGHKQVSDAMLDRYGPALFTLACVLIHDPVRAEQLVTRTIASRSNGFLYRTKVESRVVARRLAAQVYLQWFCADPNNSPSVTITVSPTDDSPRGALLRGLRALPDDHRAALALCTFGGHTHRQAAAVLELPTARVAELLCEAMRELDCEGRDLLVEYRQRVQPARTG